MKKNRISNDGFFCKGKMDIGFFSLVILLLTIGLIMLFSASYSFAYTYYGNSYRFISRQLLVAIAGTCIMLFVSKVNYHIYKRFAIPLFILAIGLLILVYALPAVANVHRWISVGPLQVQPSEIGKLAIIVLFAYLISKNYMSMNKFGFIFLLLVMLGIVCALVLFETHVSATILIFTIGIVLIYVGGLSKKLTAIGIFLVAGIAAGALIVLKYFVHYATDRITIWLDPWSDPVGKGYQTIQSLLAIGSGGIFGRGLGQSRQKYLWVPEPHNDFIFSIVCEELGLIGAMIIVLLFCALIWRGFTIAMRAHDKFGSLLAVGLTFQVGLQAALNIMVVTNTIPNTGISLPFFSYGGSSLLILLFEMGIVLSVSRSSNIEKA